jgi:hypothetical protein
MPERRPSRILSPFRQGAVWVLAPLAVAVVVYLGLWHRYERAQAEAQRLPTGVAAQLARLPPHVSALVAITFTASSGTPPGRAALAARLRSAVTLVDAPGLRIGARAVGSRTAVISFTASPGRAGCAAIRLGPAAAVGVAYARTRSGACLTSERRLAHTAGTGR